jgi:hypothetical protein
MCFLSIKRTAEAMSISPGAKPNATAEPYGLIAAYYVKQKQKKTKKL